MKTVIGLAGSLRKDSYNTALLAAAAAAAPPTLTVDVRSIRGIPLYDGDLEGADGAPEIVTTLKEAIASSDGLVLATPEYNGSLPGVFKNAIDWLSRPVEDIPRVFGGKPVLIIGATPGSGGTRMAQTAWLPVVRTLGMNPWFGRQLYVGGAHRVFDDHGGLLDDTLQKRLTDLMAGFAEFAGTI